MKIIKQLSYIIGFGILGFLSGCTSTNNNKNDNENSNENSNVTQQRSDPLEKFNRKMFDFNFNVLDAYILRPVAVGWRNYVPRPARIGLSNFSVNLGEPASMVNSLLQGEPKQALNHLHRFIINTSIGIGGLVDVASAADDELAESRNVRFGSVLGHYNVDYGPYVVIPFYGSATPREDIGGIVDWFYPAYSLVTGLPGVGLYLLNGIETRASVLDQDSLVRDSTDPYIFMRETYFQNHDFKARGGKPSTMVNPNSGDIQSSIDEIDSLD